MIDFISFSLLALLLGAFYLKRSFLVRYRFLVFFIFFLLLTFLNSELLFSQYQLWQKNELTRYFLPPYQGFRYLFFYGLKNIYGKYLFSLLAALIIWLLTFLLNRFFQFKFFYQEEGLLIASSIFLIGYPFFVFYLLLSLVLFFIFSFSLSFFRRNLLFSFRHLWVPVALFVILISNWLANFYWWPNLKF